MQHISDKQFTEDIEITLIKGDLEDEYIVDIRDDKVEEADGHTPKHGFIFDLNEPLDLSGIENIIAYTLENERKSFEESGCSEEHIYYRAVEALATLTMLKNFDMGVE